MTFLFSSLLLYRLKLLVVYKNTILGKNRVDYCHQLFNSFSANNKQPVIPDSSTKPQGTM